MAATFSERRVHLPHVYSVLKQHGFVKKSGQSTAYTHTVLDGGFVRFGPIEIPDDNPLYLHLFYTEYAKSWTKGERLYFVEWPRPQQPHRLYFDFDMYFNENVQQQPVTELRRMYSVIQEAIHTKVFPTLPQNQQTLLVGSGGWSTSHKRFSGDQQERPYTKLGLHLIWRDIFIQTDWLPAIRRVILSALDTEFPNGLIDLANPRLQQLQLRNQWETVVDEHIAKRASSRMFGSAKLDWCHCKKLKIQCTHEKERNGTGKGRVDVGRVYALGAVVDYNGEMNDDLFDSFNNNKISLLLAASLCIPPTHQPPTHISVDVSSQPVRPTSSKTAATEMPSDDQHCVAIKHYLKICYNTELTKIQFNKRQRTYTCHTNCRQCFNNFDQEHNSATSYITVSLSLR